MSKKVISLLLSLMLVVSMVAVAAVSVSAEVDGEGRYTPAEGVDTNRLFFYMPSDWYNDCAETAGVYWWTGTETAPTWPGFLAGTTEHPNVYYCDVPTDTSLIIWNNAFDGGNDSSDPYFLKSLQTVNISTNFIADGDSELYSSEFFTEMEASFNGDKTALGAYADNFFYDEEFDAGFSFTLDNMIYVLNPDMGSVEPSGKVKGAGDWYFYYGNGEYGTYPTREAAFAKGAIYNTEYQPSKPDIVTTPITSPSDVAPATDPAQVAPLTVNATSNYFPKATSEYNEETKEVTITYWFKSSKKVLDLQWELTYDTSIFSYSEKNNYSTLCPVIGDYAVLNREKDGVLKYNALNLRLFDFVSEETPFLQVVFDVKDISTKAPVNTTIDLTIDVLRVSEINPDTLMSDVSKEIVLIDFFTVIENDKTSTVNVERRTTLTPSNFVVPTTTVPTTVAPTTELTTDVTEPETTGPTTIPSTTVEPEPTIPNLTVNATSNYFPKATAEYKKSTNEVVVKYWLQSSMDVLDTQWYVTYDSSILTLSEKNTPATICPVIGDNAVVNTGVKNTLKYNASNLSLFDFSSTETPFAELIFDVNDLDDVAPTTTTIDLMVDVLRVSKIDPETLRSDADEELIIVDNFEVSTDDKAVTAVVNKGTVLTPSTFVAPTIEPTTEASTTTAPVETTTGDTVPTTTVPVDTKPTTDPPTTVPDTSTTTPVVTKPASTNPTSATAGSTSGIKPPVQSGNSNAVQTGDASLAVVILSILVVATGVMFVLRKKENL